MHAQSLGARFDLTVAHTPDDDRMTAIHHRHDFLQVVAETSGRLALRIRQHRQAIVRVAVMRSLGGARV